MHRIRCSIADPISIKLFDPNPTRLTFTPDALTNKAQRSVAAGPEIAALYKFCREAERAPISRQTTTLTATGAKVMEKGLVNIRITGYLLIFAPENTLRRRP